MKKYLDKIREILQLESGMTLVELIVAMVIVSILLGATIVMLPNYRDNQALKQSSLDLNDSLRYAQTMALSQQEGDYVNWKLIDEDGEKKICVIDKSGVEEDAQCEALGKIFDVHAKVKIESNFTDIYFQGKTGIMYNMPDFDTAAIINGEIRLIHNNRDQVGDMFYGMTLAANAFSINQSEIGDDYEELEPITLIAGCMDVEAINYNPEATIDAQNCEYESVLLGCTSPNAINYNPDAGEDDGSCEYAVYGCTDLKAENYNELATIDDGSCEYAEIIDIVYGCTDREALNYNQEANEDDGSCIFGYEDGEPCNNDNQCLSGVCEYQAGSNSVVCVPKLPSGATCESDSQCESGVCERSTGWPPWIIYQQCK